jgi:hypothetical protein
MLEHAVTVFVGFVLAVLGPGLTFTGVFTTHRLAAPFQSLQ